MYEQQDIVLIPFPYSDLTGMKRRPALIVSNKKINSTEDRICCLITSNKPDYGLKIDKEFLRNGNLPFQSWIKPHRLFTIPERIIVKKLCSITKAFHDQVVTEIFQYLKRDSL